MKCILSFVLALTLMPLVADETNAFPKVGQRLTDAQVAQFARLALDGMFQEYPNKPSNVMQSAEGVRSPREMHPVFYGCFDWHSSVHGHWMLIHLLRHYPEAAVAQQIEEALETQFDPKKMQGEAAYFQEKGNASFERMYGWAWALRLAAELHSWEDARAERWREAYGPLEEVIVSLSMAYLPRLTWPIRTGVHPDTAFALGQLLDYARVVGNQGLETLIINRARDFYEKDVAYPVRYEPSGEDFFSAGLNEADLMRRILDRESYAAWLGAFFPGLAAGDLGNLLTPEAVSDVTDGKLVHLAGLNLSRAWTLNGVASVLAQDDPRRPRLTAAAENHLEAGLKYVFSGHYEGEHWLATFAVYAVAEVGNSNPESRKP